MGELLSCHQSVKREALVPSGKGSLLLIDTENVVLEDINSFFYSTCTSKSRLQTVVQKLQSINGDQIQVFEGIVTRRCKTRGLPAI